jgi:hypothetical protein
MTISILLMIRGRYKGIARRYEELAQALYLLCRPQSGSVQLLLNPLEARSAESTNWVHLRHQRRSSTCTNPRTDCPCGACSGLCDVW